ncbi:MAG: universal stress protein [Acidobacteria bacterium]|nr:MAG: universal stress protein [Acidobacteriota bacterium]
MPRWRTILVPVDFSEHSRHGLETARDIARETGGRLVLVHVVPDLLPTFVPDIAGFSDGELLHAAVERARRELEGFAPPGGLDAPGGVERRVEAGTVHAEIVRVAGEVGADLIVIATHGRTGARHLLLGSVAERVVRTAPCPVLVVKPGAPPAEGG